MALSDQLESIIDAVDAIETPNVDDVTARDYMAARASIQRCFEALARLVERLETVG